ncbi:MAG: hypothetical protein GX079_01110 [Tissierellia bacterium]|nr:hypothetical protein [Tissierellia bacterium]
MNSGEVWKTKVLSLLGFAAKSGNLVTGSFAVDRALKEGSIDLLLFSEETSKKTIASFLHQRDLPSAVLTDSATMSKLTGVSNRHVFAVKRGKLAEAMIKEISRR